jgi:hypothetical protein
MRGCHYYGQPVVPPQADRGKADGGYTAFLEDDFDPAWFDVVIEKIGEYPVLFPPNLGTASGTSFGGG